MHQLTQAQTRKAEFLAETLTLIELGKLATLPGKDGDVAAWAIYLKNGASQGVPGYTGRNHK